MLEALDVDLSRLDEGFGSRIAAAGTVNRTLLIDDAVCRFQRERPSGASRPSAERTAAEAARSAFGSPGATPSLPLRRPFGYAARDDSR